MRKPERAHGIKNIILEKIHTSLSGKAQYDVDAYLAKRRIIWKKTLSIYNKRYNSIKFDTKLMVKLQKRQENGVYIYCNPCFRTEAAIIFSKEDIEEHVLSRIGKMVNSYDIFMKQGSGWILNKIIGSQLNIYKYTPPKGGRKISKRAFSFRERLLPNQYSGKQSRSLLFLEPTSDNKCFLYCILAALFPPKDPRIRTKIPFYLPFEKCINTENLSYPVDIGQIPLFEKNNALCINVFSINKKGDIVFLYHSKLKKYDKRINLLLYKNHYTLIQKWACFLNYSNRQKRNLCQMCGQFLPSSKLLDSNTCSSCFKPKLVLNSPMPELCFKNKNEKMRFSNYRNMRKAPFIIYSDIETMAENLKNEESETTKKTKKKQKHAPISIGYLRVCTNEKYSMKKPKIFTGEKCIEQFFASLEQEIEYIESILNTINHPIQMSEKQIHCHQNETKCYVCNNYITDLKKYRDHDHLIPENNYLGAICNACNLNRTDNKNIIIPLVFHAGGKFDVNFLIQKLYAQKLHVSRVVGKSGEQIMSMHVFKNKIIIIDSLNHLSSSLAKLVEILKKSNKPFPNTWNYADGDSKGFALLSRKGVFPYSFIDEFKKLELPTLPASKFFYNTLTDEEISKDDYEHAAMVWTHFKCKNLREYMELYLSLDITLLADVFENYRAFFFNQFGLEVSRYLSLPGLSYDCMLKYTEAEIDFVYQEDMYNFLKRGTRGGVSMIPHRAFVANNNALPDYDSSKETWHIVYIDANGLYSSIMHLKLPYRELQWIDPNTLTSDTIEHMIETYRNDDGTGYFFEVDLLYPDEIKEKTKDFPLAPEHRIVSNDMLSPFSKVLQNKIGAKGDKVPKLLSTQYHKYNYVVHVENLQFYLEKGLKIIKVHKILQFQQKEFIKPYIQFCMAQRNHPHASPDEKNMWKLASNAIFGKTIQNCEKMNTITFHTDENKLLNKIASPRFKHADLINEKVAQVTSYKKKYCINTPYFVGVAILELSKLFIMRVYYNIFLEKYGIQKLKLLLTDTDSLLLAIQTEDIYKDLAATGIVEFGNFPISHPYYKQEETGKIFYFKDESCGQPIQSFVGLRSKCYSIHYPKGGLKDKISAKGVNRSQIKKFCHEDINEVLTQNKTTETTSRQIRSFKHQVYNIEQEKLSLSGMDTKRWVCWDNITTLPFGHPFADEDVENFLGKKHRVKNYVDLGKISEQNDFGVSPE